MTSKLTREQLLEHARENVKALKMASRQTAFESAREGILADLQLAELALSIADSEPVVPDYPETLPCPVLLEPGLRFGKGVKTRLVLEAIQRRAEHCSELESMTPEERAEYDAGIEEFKAMLPQPALVVPDDYQRLRELYHAQEKRLFKIAQRIKGPAFDKYSHSASQAIDVLESAIFGEIDACRAAMLQGAENTESRCGNSPVIPDRWIPVSERMPETDGNYWGWWSESKRQGPAWFIKSELQAQFQSSEITHWMPLPAAPQEVK